MTNLETIRAACVKANPEIMSVTDTDPEDDAQDFRVNARPIRLADVLLAMQAKSPAYVHTALTDEVGVLALSVTMGDGEVILVGWNLRLGDLEKQSPETLEFLANLLKV